MTQTRPTLTSLPVEIQIQILQYVLYLSQECIGTSQPSSPNEPEDNQDIHYLWDWIERDNGDIAQFPYSVAAVCQLWLDILAKIPECWTRVIIDVASDPTRFLDIFSWSKDLPELDVIVFNSQKPDPEDVNYSLLERKRVSAIVNALLPHTSRCKSISINFAFLTSLPSPVVFLLKDAPDLEDLILGCTIDNAGAPDDYSNACELGVRQPIQTLPSFPKLNNFALTGFWFMFISGHPHTSEWFTNIRGEAARFLLTISHFKFQKEGQYTVQNFVEYCSAIRPDPIVLDDLSLDHDEPLLEGDNYNVNVFTQESVVFSNVSPDVLRSMFFLAEISPRYLTFDNCTFPDEILPIGATELTLENIHSRSSANPTAHLRSILQEFNGDSLFVNNCSAFDDNALSALPSYRYSPLRMLGLSNCENFTVHGLRQYLERRNKYEIPHRDFSHGPLQCLDVDGVINNCPFPSEEDEEWFENSEYGQPIHVDWSVKHPETQVTLRRYKK